MPPEAPDAWADIIQIQPIQVSRPVPPTPARRRWRGTAARFALIVLLPTLLASGYFTLVAADRYVAEAKFQVRKPNAPGRGPTQSLSIEEGPKGIGSDDSYAVQDFMLSRDAVQVLERQANLRAALTRAQGDPFWQFPSLINGHSDEDLYEQYQSLVSVDYESSTGMTTLRVQAFAPDDARRIASALMVASEALLNQLNERARHDAVQVAETEVARSRAEARKAQENLTAFRDRESVIDPTLLSQTVLTTISNLSLQLVEAAAQLDVTVHSSPNSPQITPLRGRVQALQDQIDHERATLAGSDRSLAPKIAEYERLMLEREFAEKTFISTLNLLEAARLDAERQQEYLERVVEPAVPDKARYPRTVLWTSCVFLTGLIIFRMFRPGPIATGAHLPRCVV